MAESDSFMPFREGPLLPDDASGEALAREINDFLRLSNQDAEQDAWWADIGLPAEYREWAEGLESRFHLPDTD